MPDHQSIDPSDVLAAVGLPAASESTSMRGAEATVWRVLVDGTPLALRLHRTGSTTVERELVALRIAGGAGLPVPELVVEGMWRDRAVAVTTWCPGRTVTELLLATDGPARVAAGRRFGRAHALVHASVLTPADAAQLRRVGRPVQAPAGLVNDAAGLVSDVAERPALLHLDFHPYNVLDDGARITGIVDWANTTIGDRRFDIARTRGLFALAGAFVPGSPERAKAASRELTALWAQGYAEILPMPGDSELAPFLAVAGESMHRDWEPRTAAGEVDGSILTAIEAWTAQWTEVAS